MNQLLGRAHHIGVRVLYSDIDDDPDLLGYASIEHRAIVLRRGMTNAQTRSVLAHEIAHIELGHECTTDAREIAADRRAARLLITHADYVRAERIDDSEWAIAEALDVTPDVVRAYRDHLNHTGPIDLTMLAAS